MFLVTDPPTIETRGVAAERKVTETDPVLDTFSEMSNGHAK